MAEVWRGLDERLDRIVAVKIFDDEIDDPVALTRQQAETRALSELDHPNLVAFLDARHGPAPGGATHSDTGHAYLVMELVEGPTLAQRLTSGPLRVAEAKDIAAGIAGALAAAHSRGLVHRDVKPANILLGKDETGRIVPKLSDFGIAQRLGAGRITKTRMVVGTAAYLSPEQARGADVGPATDVYALGLVMLEALTGHREFDGPPLQAAAARLHRNPRVPAELPAPWPQLLTAMTQLDPPSRPSASVVLGVLEGRARVPVRRNVPAPPPAALTSQIPLSATAPATAVRPGVPPPRPLPLAAPPPASRRSGTNWLPIVILVVVAIAAAALVVAILAGRDSPGGGGQTTPASTPTTPRTTPTTHVTTPTTDTSSTSDTSSSDTTTNDTSTSDTTSERTTPTQTTGRTTPTTTGSGTSGTTGSTTTGKKKKPKGNGPGHG